MLTFRSYIIEGNPLARLKGLDGKGYHSIIISGERKSNTKEQNKASMDKLKNHFSSAGYGFRKTEGKWDEGTGIAKENSLHVTAKSPGRKGAAELIAHTRAISSHLDQDAFIHRTPSGEGHAIFTHNTADNKAGDKVHYGKTKYNEPNPYGQTRYKPSKPEKSSPTFTFKE